MVTLLGCNEGIFVGGMVGGFDTLRLGNKVGCCFVGVRVGLDGTMVGLGEGLDVGCEEG